MAGSNVGPLTADSLRRLRQIDDCCDRFLKRWKVGERPRIEDELAAAGTALADELLSELLPLEIELRAAEGQTISFREYCERFPGLDPALIRQAIDRTALGASPRGAAPTMSLSDVQLAGDSLACSPQELADSVVRHGLAGASIVDRVRRRLPADKTADAAALLAELTASGCVTPYQGERIRAGQITDLVFGDYVILDRIGRGGMGDVLKARQRRMDRIVALKVVSERGLKNSSALERFQQEVRAAAHLQHANIVTAFDAGEERGTPYLVMEYVAGEDLSTRIRRDGPLSVEQAVECLRQAAKGLDYAHRKGVIHRDIKPANLLLDEEGNVKILDLGLARVHSQLAVAIDSETENGGDLTASGDVLGTLDYLPPEQAESSRRADARSDIYSLGCTLWWLLTGRAVYVRETKVERLVAHREAPVPSLLEARPDVPAELADLCRRMLAKRPDDRPQTMREVLEALKPLSAGDSTLTSRTGDTAPADPALTAFLRASDPTVVRAREALRPPRRGGWNWLPRIALAAAFAAVIVAGVVIIRLNTPEGTLVLEINQPDARVQVFSAEGKIEIDQAGGEGKVTLTIEPGRHEVRVEKDGFRLYAEKFSIVDGETETIHARLVPAPNLAVMTPDRRAAEWCLATGGSAYVTIRQANGDRMIKADEDLPTTPFEVVILSPNGDPRIDDASLRNLAGLKSIVAIGLVKTGVTDEGLEEISKLTSLRELNLAYTHISDAGLKHLRPLTTLFWLAIEGQQFSDGAVEEILANPKFRTLLLKNTRLTDAGLARLCQLPDLAQLSIAGTQVTDAGLTHLPTTLSSLEIGGPQVTDNGLSHLRTLTGLTELSIEAAAISDAGLEDLAALTGLRSLSLQQCDVTQEEVAKLHAALPGCTIVSDHGTIEPIGVDGIDYAAERRAAEWLRSVGAYGYVVHSDGTYTALEAEELPESPFYVQKLTIFGKSDLSDADLAPLAECRQILEVSLQGARLDGSGLSYLLPSRATLRSLNLSGSLNSRSVTQNLVVLERFTELRELNLDWNGELTDEVLAHVGRLTKLETLGLIAFKGSDMGLAQLDGLMNLRGLDLGATPEISDAGVERLVTHNRALRNVSIRYGNSGPESARRTLGPLAAARELQQVCCSGDQLTNDGLAALQQLPDLQTVLISLPTDQACSGLRELPRVQRAELFFWWPEWTFFTQEAYHVLAGHPSIVELKVHGVAGAPNDESLQALAKMPALRSLSIEVAEDKRPSTAAGISAFRAARPDVKLTIWGEPNQPSAIAVTSDPQPAVAPFDTEQARQHQEAWAAHLGVPVEYTNSIGMKFRLIPPGEFVMGSTPEEIEAAVAAAGDDPATVRMIESEGPVHRVTLTKPFYLGIHEVTQGQYAAVLESNPAHFSATGAGKDAVAGIDTLDFPVEMTSWSDGAQFCIRLSEREALQPCYRQAEGKLESIGGAGYRLPTEAEWEYACRAGTTTMYCAGDTDAALQSVAWFGLNAVATHPVGALAANPFGIHDMHGNVWELAADDFEYDTYATAPAIDPARLGGAAPARVIRGGGWAFSASNARSASRNAAEMDIRSQHTGFRVVVSVEAVRLALAPQPAVAPFDAEQARQHQEAWAEHLGVPVEYTNSIGMKFRLIPPGEFTMGSTPEEMEAALAAVEGDQWKDEWKERIPSESPRHQVILSRAIYMASREVTQAEYEQVMGKNPSYFAPAGGGKDAIANTDTRSHPVELVSWNDAAEFCAKLTEKERLKPVYFRSGGTVTMLAGAGYRLPTEAEWEFACRGGTSTKYWSGDQDEALSKVGWHRENAGNRIHAVAELQANPLGLFDMHGNAWEWVQDWSGLDYYRQFADKPAIDPIGPEGPASERVVRGGSWGDHPSGCRAAVRGAMAPTGLNLWIGFRVALPVEAVRQERSR